jgi:hypothetical protein
MAEAETMALTEELVTSIIDEIKKINGNNL